MLKSKPTQPQVRQKPRRDPSVGRDTNPIDPGHWSFQVHETLVSALPDESLRVALEGGADNGLFCFVDNVHADDVIYHSGKLKPDHIFLEVQGQRIAGYTQRDANIWLQQVSQNGSPVMIKSVKSGALPKDLRQYLTARFPKGSIDHDLQQTIRDNLYLRTVPCTTRVARPGEVNGVDYTFLSQKDFDALELSGQLLESGIFDGNQYGTPKPPKDPAGPIPQRSNSVNSGLPGAHLSSDSKRRRNRSNSDAPPPKSPGTPRKHEPPPPPVRGRSSERSSSNESLGPLPPGWEMAFTEEGHPYFIDHATEQTHWLDPRRPVKQGTQSNDDSLELPYGWEKVEDPHYGTYYIDHVNRKTQYEHPGKVLKKSATADELSSNSTLPRRGKLEDTAKRSASESDMNGRSTPPAYHPRPRKHKTPLSKRVAAKRVFAKDPKDLKGDMFSTQLLKGERGLGFTIIGGDTPDEEFLQIKNVVRNGPAFIDGKLQTGDVLVHVNNLPVLGFTHQDVVGLFQTILPGDTVDLDICRGYPLPFDPDDPNTEIITTIAVTPLDDTRGSNSPASYSSRENMDHHNTSVKSLKSLPDLAKTNNSGPDNGMTPDVLGLIQTPEILEIHIERGEWGFGFTIADSVYGQKVKQILDATRCKNLQEGDLLQEINNVRVSDMTHSQIVQVLKECPKGEETRIVVQRGGIPVKGKKPARPPDNGETSFNSNPGAYFFNEKNDSGRPIVNGEGYMNMSREVRDASDGSVPPRKQIVEQQRPKTPTGMEARPKTPTKLPLQSDNRPKPTTNLSNSAHLPRKEYAPRDEGKENRDGADFLVNNSRPPPGPRFEPFRSDSGLGRRTNYATQNAYDRESRFDTYARSESAARPGQFRSRTPGPEMMQRSQGPDYRPDPPRPKTPTAQDMRSKTPIPGMYGQISGGNPEYSNTRFQNSWGPGVPYRAFDANTRTMGTSIPEHSVMQSVQQRRDDTFSRSLSGVPGGAGRPPRQSTSFESENPSPSNITRIPKKPPFSNMFSNQMVGAQSPKPFQYPGNTEDNSKFIEMNVTLLRQESGFGFRIIGGTEEGSQVAVGHIVPGGAADIDGRLRTGDEILFCDGVCVINSSHHKVVQLMGNAGFRGQVSLGVRRRVAPVAEGYPYDITVTRRETEGFGFVIISSVTKAGSTIGRILENSPAERCGQLHVGDRILAVNGVDISHLHHEDIVNIIKESGYSVTLTVGPPQDDSSSNTSTQGSMVNAHAYPAQNDTDGRREFQSGYNRFPPPPPKEINRQRSLGPSDIQDGQMYGVELNRGHRGFGFSIRGGQEFNNMPLFVLRIAEGGAADLDGRLRVGDQLLEINGYTTESMTHSEAIDIIQNGGSIARLLVRRTGKPPPSFEPTSSGSRYQSGTMSNGPIGQSSPYLGRRNVPLDRDEHVYSNQPFRTYLNN